jgi:hypothetical protein
MFAGFVNGLRIVPGKPVAKKDRTRSKIASSRINIADHGTLLCQDLVHEDDRGLRVCLNQLGDQHAHTERYMGLHRPAAKTVHQVVYELVVRQRFRPTYNLSLCDRLWAIVSLEHGRYEVGYDDGADDKEPSSIDWYECIRHSRASRLVGFVRAYGQFQQGSPSTRETSESLSVGGP